MEKKKLNLTNYPVVDQEDLLLLKSFVKENKLPPMMLDSKKISSFSIWMVELLLDAVILSSMVTIACCDLLLSPKNSEAMDMVKRLFRI